MPKAEERYTLRLSSQKPRRNSVKQASRSVCDWLSSPFTPIPPEDFNSEWEDDEDYAERMKFRASKSRNCFQKFVFSNAFEVLVMLAITGCVLILGMEAACYKAKPACTDEYEDILLTAENVFIGLFVLEWFFRLGAEGLEYFNSFEHLCDTFIIWVTCVLLQWGIPLVSDDIRKNEYVRALNSLRGLRTLRFISVLKHLKSFRVLVSGLFFNAHTLFACVFLLVSLDGMFGIAAVEIIGNYEGWGRAPEGTTVYEFQHGLPSACMALSRLLTHDGAIKMIEDLVKKQPFIAIFCFIYMSIASLLILNLVIAAIIEKAHTMAKDSQDEKSMMKKQQETDKIQEVKKLLQTLDSGTGKVTFDDLELCFRDTNYRKVLLAFGLTEDEMKQLYQVLDTDEEGELSIQELCDGLRKVSGEADARSMLEAKKKAEAVEHMLWTVSPPDVISESSTLAARRAASLEEITGESFEEQLYALEEQTNARLNSIQMMVRNCRRTANGLEDQIRKRSKARL